MINELKNVELEYVRCFSKEKNFENHIEFKDEEFRDTYTSNVSILKNDISDEKLITLINREIKFLNTRKKDFLNFEINKEVSKDIIKKFIRKPKRIDVFNYFVIESQKFKNMNQIEYAFIKKAEKKEEFKKILDINVKDNGEILGRSYALYRIKRKIKAYKDANNNLESYICYYEEKPVGACEVLRKDNICKIEEVVILKKYRCKGLSANMIRTILEENCERGVEYTYLICEQNGKAENLYKRLGFYSCGKKTQLIW